MTAIGAGIIGYASFWAAMRLMGLSRAKGAYYAVAPAAAAAFMNMPCITAHGFVLKILTAMLFCIGITADLLILSGRKWVPAIIAALLGLSSCMAGQLMSAAFAINMNGPQACLPGIILYIISLPLWNKKACIFRENSALTSEQKKSLRGLLTSLFPGPAVLFLWSIFSLTDSDLHIPPVLLFNIVFFLLVCLMLSRLTAEMQEHLENLLGRQYQENLLGFMRLIRSQRHDFNFHMQTVYGMIDKGLYSECSDYIRSMLSIVQSSNDVLPLANPAVSALLSTFQEMALQKGLRLDVEIHDNLGHIPCTVYEINTILGNLIQNAIDELENHTEGSRVISLLIIKRGRSNIIKVSNYCHHVPEDMKEIFSPGYTTKPAHEGLGLANAAHMAEKYQGVVYPEFEGNTIHMIARIPMKSM